MYFTKQSVALEQATVTLIILIVDREPGNTIIESREVDGDLTLTYNSDEKPIENYDTNETYGASYVNKTRLGNVVGRPKLLM